MTHVCCVFVFFQAEDGIRDLTVTGVQTCALPISTAAEEIPSNKRHRGDPDLPASVPDPRPAPTLQTSNTSRAIRRRHRFPCPHSRSYRLVPKCPDFRKG